MIAQDKFVKPEPHEDGYWQSADTEIIREAEDDVLTRPAEDPAEKAREEAFNAVYSWKGTTFDGLSCARKDLWLSVCHKAEFPPLLYCFDDLTYFPPLAKALLFCCITPTRALRKLRGEGIQAVVDACEDWTEKNVKIHEEKEAVALALRVLNDSSENQAEAAATSSTPGK
jgi:hypothetical protein